MPPYAALLDAVRGLRWPAHRPVRGGAPGPHVARARGVSAELSEYRPYRQGDDPRRLDWRLLARSDRAYVRLSPDRAVLPTLLVVDASASMAFPVATRAKWALACRVAVALAAVAHAQGDPVGLSIAAATARRLAPRTRRGVVQEIASTLAACEPGASPPLAPHAAAFRGRLVLLTDLLGDADALRAAAAIAMARGGEVHVVHVLARDEMAPPAAPSEAFDPEAPALRRTLGPTTRAAYVTAFAAWRAEAARAWRATGARYTEAVDDEAADQVARRVVAGPAPLLAPAGTAG